MRKYILFIVLLLINVSLFAGVSDKLDVRITNPVSGDELKYSSNNRKWINFTNNTSSFIDTSYAITNQTNYTWTDGVPATYICGKIIIDETSGNNSGNIRVGTTNGGEQIVSDVTVNANDTHIIECNWDIDWASATTLYINSDSWGSGEIKVYLLINDITQ